MSSKVVNLAEYRQRRKCINDQEPLIPTSIRCGCDDYLWLAIDEFEEPPISGSGTTRTLRCFKCNSSVTLEYRDK